MYMRASNTITHSLSLIIYPSLHITLTTLCYLSTHDSYMSASIYVYLGILLWIAWSLGHRPRGCSVDTIYPPIYLSPVLSHKPSRWLSLFRSTRLSLSISVIHWVRRIGFLHVDLVTTMWRVLFSAPLTLSLISEIACVASFHTILTVTCVYTVTTSRCVIT